MPEEWLRTPYLLVPVGYPADGCRVPDIQKKPLEEIRIVTPRGHRERPTPSRE